MLIIQWLRSLLFVVLMYVGMAVYAIGGLPWAIHSQDGALKVVHAYTGFVRFIARWLVGLQSEIRGTVPDIECVVAAKHQSFFDIILLVDALPRPKLIMKSILRYAPFVGYYGLRIGCVPVNRGKRAQAIQQMKEGVTKGLVRPGQMVIFPQGTRVPPGEKRPFKVGAGVLYTELQQTCVPVATNVGVFWPKRSMLRKPGVAVVEFLDPIVPGLAIEPFMKQLEAVIEAKSESLMAEAGFKP